MFFFGWNFNILKLMCINSMFFVYRCQSALVEGWMWARAENQKPNKSFWRMGPVQDGVMNEVVCWMKGNHPSPPPWRSRLTSFLEIHYRGNRQPFLEVIKELRSIGSLLNQDIPFHQSHPEEYNKEDTGTNGALTFVLMRPLSYC